jgi:hypothetical protein
LADLRVACSEQEIFMMRWLGSFVVLAVLIFAGLSTFGCSMSSSSSKDKMTAPGKMDDKMGGGKMDDKMGGKMDDKMGRQMEDKK